jgi:hypothetical protein
VTPVLQGMTEKSLVEAAGIPAQGGWFISMGPHLTGLLGFHIDY